MSQWVLYKELLDSGMCHSGQVLHGIRQGITFPLSQVVMKVVLDTIIRENLEAANLL